MAVKMWLGGASGSTGDLSVASNYAPTGVPTNGDDLYIEANPSGTDYSITTNLTTFQNTTLNSINISQTYTGTIGTANTGTSSTTTGYMSLSGTNTAALTVSIGYQYGGTTAAGGSQLIRLNTGSANATITVTNTAASSAMTNAGPVTLLANSTAATLNIISGTVSVAQNPTETGTLKIINSRGTITIGPSFTLTNSTINCNGGVCSIRSQVATINQTAGGLVTSGTGSISTFNVQGGTAVINSTGTITALNVYGATANLSGNPASRTITTVTLYSGAALNLNNGVKNSITITNPIVVNAGPGQFTITAWFGSSFALS